MIPVPSYQVVAFLEWLQGQGLRVQIEDQERLTHAAMEFLRSGGREMPTRRRPLEAVLKVFQACPMIQESTLTDQLKHFTGCGRCIEYISRDSIRAQALVLHPLLERFLRWSRESGFTEHFVHHAEQFHGELENREGERPDDLAIDRWFRELIRRTGPDFRQAFERFLESAPSELVRDFEETRRRGVWQRQGRREEDLDRRGPEYGTEPIGKNESIENAAWRLVGSVELMVKQGIYDETIGRDPHVMHLMSCVSDVSEHLAQSLQFLEWFHERHPQLDIAGDIPVQKLIELVREFCEAQGYSNAGTFTKVVLKCLRGEGNQPLARRFWDFVSRIFRGGRHLESSNALFKRYTQVKAHGIFFFLATGRFPEFIEAHWVDLNALTGEAIDIYYSAEDLKFRSGYESLEEFKDLRVQTTALPALVLWTKSFKDAVAISLGELPHEDVVSVVKQVVQGIKNGQALAEVAEAVNVWVQKRQRELRLTSANFHETKIIINGGETIMGDQIKQNISGGTFYGPVAAKMEHCTNIIGQQSNDQRKQLLTAVQREAEALIRQLPEAQREDAADNLKLLVDSAVAKEPKRRWYEVSAQGLLDASKFVKDFTGNIAGTIGQLGKLLWPDFQLPSLDKE
jgi:hypothetical protein